MRISSPSAQAGIVVVAVILMPMIGVVLAVVTPWWGATWMLVATTVLVVFAARTFRGAGETSAPRPWWQMTAAPLASALLSVVFLGQAAFSLFSAWSPPLVVSGNLGAVILLAIGAAYANSAIRRALALRAAGCSRPRLAEATE
ncbi:hypothetical protein [Microbacterium sp. WCS2018Hpa-23]|uniref:hypothetical protein n=1 Tax=Microbacterium sp. WCS2018Hpa-23 TaxID=3073634 RepID=UPI002882EAA1|nr:hypothetical protein [Microbacterium sp. WCS2018Hpa-23]